MMVCVAEPEVQSGEMPKRWFSAKSGTLHCSVEDEWDAAGIRLNQDLYSGVKGKLNG